MLRFLILLFGTAAMIPIMLIFNRFYRVPFLKLLICTVMLTITGLIGGAIMYFIENSNFGGFSFYGAIFLAPLQMYFIAKLINASPSAIVDLCAPVGCIMLAVQKTNCLRVGCCQGKIIAQSIAGQPIRFPSQIIECAAALLISLFLYLLVSSEKFKGKILFFFLIFYGIIRFFLNLMRDTTPALFGLAVGNIWSIVSVIVGIVGLTILRFNGNHTKE